MGCSRGEMEVIQGQFRAFNVAPDDQRIELAVAAIWRIAPAWLDQGPPRSRARSGTSPHCPVETPSSQAAFEGYAGHRGNKSNQRVSPVSRGTRKSLSRLTS